MILVVEFFFVFFVSASFRFLFCAFAIFAESLMRTGSQKNTFGKITRVCNRLQIGASGCIWVHLLRASGCICCVHLGLPLELVTCHMSTESSSKWVPPFDEAVPSGNSSRRKTRAIECRGFGAMLHACWCWCIVTCLFLLGQR